jgi:hypothetical protein
MREAMVWLADRICRWVCPCQCHAPTVIEAQPGPLGEPERPQLLAALPGFEHLAPSRAEGVTIAHFASRGRGDWRQGPPSSAPANENALVTLAEYRYLRCITWRLETGSGEASYSAEPGQMLMGGIWLINRAQYTSTPCRLVVGRGVGKRRQRSEVVGGEHLDQATYRQVRFGRVAQALIGVDGVVVAPPDPFAIEVAGLVQVADDALHGALGYADDRGDVAQPRLRVAGDLQQHPRVVGQKGPGRRSSIRHGASHSRSCNVAVGGVDPIGLPIV